MDVSDQLHTKGLLYLQGYIPQYSLDRGLDELQRPSWGEKKNPCPS
jgi:hypothetical protein